MGHGTWLAARAANGWLWACEPVIRSVSVKPVCPLFTPDNCCNFGLESSFLILQIHSRVLALMQLDVSLLPGLSPPHRFAPQLLPDSPNLHNHCLHPQPPPTAGTGSGSGEGLPTASSGEMPRAQCRARRGQVPRIQMQCVAAGSAQSVECHLWDLCPPTAASTQTQHWHSAAAILVHPLLAHPSCHPIRGTPVLRR